MRKTFTQQLILFLGKTVIGNIMLLWSACLVFLFLFLAGHCQGQSTQTPRTDYEQSVPVSFSIVTDSVKTTDRTSQQLAFLVWDAPNLIYSADGITTTYTEKLQVHARPNGNYYLTSLDGAAFVCNPTEGWFAPIGHQAWQGRRLFYSPHKTLSIR